jgi:hypothetical protein
MMTKQNARRGRGPWWLAEEEKNNPRILPEYTPWWKVKNFPVDATWKLLELSTEAKRRGISIAGMKKAEAIERLNEEYRKFSLSDDNFTTPVFLTPPELSHPCYPEIYMKQ